MEKVTEAAAIEAVVRGDHADPFSVLGMHRNPAGLALRAFRPDAESVTVIDAGSDQPVVELVRRHREGFFDGVVPGRKGPFAYRLRVRSGNGEWEVEDPYRFGTILGTEDLSLLQRGEHFEAYCVLGAHPVVMDGIDGVAFAVWAPNARRVSVVGAFNAWDGRVHAMRNRSESGVWEIFLPRIAEGTIYKYEILGAEGKLLPLKADPFAFYSEQPPSTASVVARTDRYEWRDGAWLDSRARKSERDAPISIYEVHLGSWMRKPEEGNRYLSYEELADTLIPYVKDLGFTHIELMPITEHPFDGSWGYQPIGLFAPTSRFGAPENFQAFVDRCHAEGIGVIIDWVPGHFPNDTHGLGLFDGTHLYEHADPRKGRHMDWDTLIYNFGRREVANFLACSALFWLDRYHVDGLRVDAVASMLYLDYSRKEGEWEPNEYGGNENLEAIRFLKLTNEQAYGKFPGTVTIAEESTAWPMVSQPTYLGGLGFGYKWNMGWMHDTLRYMSKEPVHRRYHHNDLTFGLVYAFSENFVLPLSHDEVVHGKGSLLNKMPGDRWQKFANLRTYLAFMFGHPGKKLLFMGGEFAQEREWNHDRGLDWHLLDDPDHRGVRDLVRDLNNLYRSIPALHARDCVSEGFEWIDSNDSENCVLSFIRRAADADDFVIVVSNFTPVVRYGYRIGVPAEGAYVELLNTDADGYGGSNVANPDNLVTAPEPMHGRPYSLTCTLPPLATLFLSLRRNA